MSLRAEIQSLLAASSRIYSLPFWLLSLFLVVIFLQLVTLSHVYTFTCVHQSYHLQAEQVQLQFPDPHLLSHIPHHLQPQMRFDFSKFIPACLENISVFLLRCLSHVPLPCPPLRICGSCSWMLSQLFRDAGMLLGIELTGCCLACGFKREGDVDVLLRVSNHHSSWSSNLSHGSQAQFKLPGVNAA